MNRLLAGKDFSTLVLLLWVVMTASGCTNLVRQEPEVILSDLQLLPAQGLAPRFSVSMQMINPNNADLDVKGGAFRLYLKNSRVAVGVLDKPFLVPPLGQSTVTAYCTGDLIGSVSLFHKLMQSNAHTIEYRLELTLHETHHFLPIRLQRDGVVNLSKL